MANAGRSLAARIERLEVASKESDAEPRVFVTIVSDIRRPLLGYRVYLHDEKRETTEVSREPRERDADLRARAQALANERGKGIVRVLEELRGP